MPNAGGGQSCKACSWSSSTGDEPCALCPHQILRATVPPDAKKPATVFIAGFFLKHGGEGGIRTLDTENRIPDFESGAFDHSATSPVFVSNCGFYHRSTALTDATPPGRPGTVATRQESRCCRRLVDGFPARRPTPAPRPGQSRSMYAPARSCPPRS